MEEHEFLIDKQAKKYFEPEPEFQIIWLGPYISAVVPADWDDLTPACNCTDCTIEPVSDEPIQTFAERMKARFPNHINLKELENDGPRN